MQKNHISRPTSQRIQGYLPGSLAIVFALLALIVTGCQDNDHLTNAMALQALKEGLTSPDTVTSVIGIREIPEQNAAEVEFQFTGLNYEYFDTIWGKGNTTYSGPATAIFHKFNDGRWVLKTVSFKNPKTNSWAQPRGLMRE